MFKIDWLFYFFVSSIVVFCRADLNKKSTYPLDIVLILDDSQSVTDSDFDRMLIFVRRLPDYFRVNRNFARVAVVVYSAVSRIELNLTDDEFRLRNFEPSSTRQRNQTNTLSALKDAEKIFENKNRLIDRQNIVILITDGESMDMPATEKLASDLRNRSLIYVVFVSSWYDRKKMTQEHVQNLTGDRRQVFSIDNFADLNNIDLCLRIRYRIDSMVCPRFAERVDKCPKLEPPIDDSETSWLWIFFWISLVPLAITIGLRGYVELNEKYQKSELDFSFSYEFGLNLRKPASLNPNFRQDSLIDQEHR